jgi:hypothetical protein
MTDNDAFDAVLRSWLDEQPDRAPRGTLPAVLTSLRTTKQRGRWRAWLAGLPDAVATIRRQPALAVSAAAAIVVTVIAAVLILPGRAPLEPSGGSATPAPSLAPTPSTTPSLRSASPTASQASEGWPGAVRPEPPGGAPDVELVGPVDERFIFTDSVGEPEPSSSTIDIATLELQMTAPGADDRGAAMRVRMMDPLTGIPDPAEQWIAFGVVIDDDADGIGDFRIGMDNAPGDRHREWVTDLSTGETFVNPGPGYGSSAFGTFFDTFYQDGFGEDDPLILFYPPGQGPGVRFYAWASIIRPDAEPVTDFAPNAGWVQYLPEPISRGR